MFSLTSPLVSLNRRNLTAFLSVDSQPGQDYGQFQLLELPDDQVTDGPQQVQNNIESTTAVSTQLTLLRQGGSSSRARQPADRADPRRVDVRRTDLCAVGRRGSFPELREVAAVYNGTVAYQPTCRLPWTRCSACRSPRRRRRRPRPVRHRRRHQPGRRPVTCRPVSSRPSRPRRRPRTPAQAALRRGRLCGVRRRAEEASGSLATARGGGGRNVAVTDATVGGLVLLRSSGYRGETDAGWSSSVARWAHNPEVVGSNPTPATEAKPQVRAMINDHGPDAFQDQSLSLIGPYNPEVQSLHGHIPSSCR